MQEITRNVANIFSFFAIIAIKHGFQCKFNVANIFSFFAIIAIKHGYLCHTQPPPNIGIKHGFQCINIRQVPWEVLKTAAFGLGFQHLPRDLANVNAWKTMFDPYIWGWLGVAKVMGILHHWGVQLILASSRARPAILLAGKGRGGTFLFLLFLHFNSCSSFFPDPLFHLLYYLFYIFSPFLWETTQNDPQGLTCR